MLRSQSQSGSRRGRGSIIQSRRLLLLILLLTNPPAPRSLALLANFVQASRLIIDFLATSSSPLKGRVQHLELTNWLDGPPARGFRASLIYNPETRSGFMMEIQSLAWLLVFIPRRALCLPDDSRIIVWLYKFTDIQSHCCTHAVGVIKILLWSVSELAGFKLIWRNFADFHSNVLRACSLFDTETGSCYRWCIIKRLNNHNFITATRRNSAVVLRNENHRNIL